MTDTANSAARRALPPGYDDGEHPYFVPRPFRTHYQCVSEPEHADPFAALDRHIAILDAAADWAYSDHVRRHGPGIIPG